MLHIAPPLLAWFHENRRTLPFREDPTPYHIWVSEIMLQQTRMSTVLPYYARFMEAFPTPADLAASDLDHLHKLWEGLGYYSRANNLRRAARILVDEYGGEMPREYGAIRALPGIGDYTAGAIASISMGMAVPAVDGNVLRVFARLYNDRSDVLAPHTKRRVTAQVTEELPADAAGDFNQALMELGALICTPGEPGCEGCPLRELCMAHRAGTAALLPYRSPKKPRRVEEWLVLLMHSKAGWLLHRRPEGGLLSGLWEPILFSGDCTPQDAVKTLWPTCVINESRELGASKHLFSHIEWRMTGWVVEIGDAPEPPEGCLWVKEADLGEYAIPSAFRAYREELR